MNELKPCPFCGGEEIQLVDNRDPRTGEEDWVICCMKCGIAVLASNDAMPCTASTLVQRWNSRTMKFDTQKDQPCYWPMARTNTGEKLYNKDSAPTIEKAIRQFMLWEEYYHYKIVEAWILTKEKKRIDVEHRWIARETR